jgi:hypothetical protein
MSKPNRLAAISLTAALALGALNTGSRRAEAIVGATLFGNIPMAIVGGVALAAGAALTTGAIVYGDRNGTNGAFDGMLIAGSPLIALGFVLLDSDRIPLLSLLPVNDEQARAMGLTPGEKTAYNDNLDELNAIIENITADMKRAGNASIEISKEDWLRDSQALSPEARSAAEKVSIAISRKLAARSGA